SALAAAKINIQMITTSEIKISCVVALQIVEQKDYRVCILFNPSSQGCDYLEIFKFLAFSYFQ
ncbi:MAG: hypothetical protein AAFW67_11035, partial [Cyanobacteria bacterium J06638_38]